MIDQTLGHYRVVAKIGEGGMGEVYRARDTTLDRDVALKVLPEAFTADPDRLARFEREAKVLASLNHPNIGQIYGLERAPSAGSGQAGVQALVLELIEGPTLADLIENRSGRSSDRPIRGAEAPRLQGGERPTGLPVDEALGIATQIAEALEAAHEQGVIHRDLKPANVKVRPDGTVKVLDFGLAKAIQPETTDAGASLSPTISLTAAATQLGMVIGTAAYMAPEQAKGQPVDRRADIWAFGAVLFEMLTGKRLFEAGDVSEMLASVLVKEPDVSSIGAEVPQHVRSVVRRCLVKDPKERLRDIGDVRLALAGKFEMTSAAPVTSETVQSLRLWQRPVPLLVAALALVVATALAVRLVPVREPTDAPPTTRFTVSLREGEVMPTQAGSTQLAVSPDGRTLVYGAAARGGAGLFRRRLDEIGAVQISNQAPDGSTLNGSPFFSPDGQWVGRHGGSQIDLMPLLGGPSQTIPTERFASAGAGASWGMDDTIVYGAGSLMQVPAAGGDTIPLVTLDDPLRAQYPQVLTDVGAVLFTVSDPRQDGGELRLLDLATGQQRLLMSGATYGRVLDSGHLVFARSGSLWAAPFDRRRLEVVGTPLPVVEGVRVEATGAVQYAVSGNGTLAYVPGAVDGGGERRLVWVDRRGNEQPLPTPVRPYQELALSPDGGRIAVVIRDGGNDDIWVSELSRGGLVRLTTDGAIDTNPLWSPDGRRVVFRSDRNGTPELFWQPTDDSVPAERILAMDEPVTDIVPSGWGEDGDILFVRVNRAATGRDIGMVRLGPEGTGIWEPLLETEADEWWPALSPDGRWLAYTSNETGLNEVYFRRFPQLDRRILATAGGGFGPNWSADGGEILYFEAPSGPPVAVSRVTVEVVDGEAPTLEVGAPERLFDYRYHVVFGGRRYYDLAPDGDRMLMLGFENEQLADAGINVVVNWDEELKRLVPLP